MNELKAKDKWVIDFGCTYHMTSRFKWFSDFQENGATMILLGDDHTVESRWSGTIKLNTHGSSIKVMMDQKLIRSDHNPCVYVKEVNHEEYVYLLYVDDMLLATKSMIKVNKLKEVLSLDFEMKDMGTASRISCIDIIKNRKI